MKESSCFVLALMQARKRRAVKIADPVHRACGSTPHWPHPTLATFHLLGHFNLEESLGALGLSFTHHLRKEDKGGW